MAEPLDLTGQRFGRFVVLSLAGSYRGNRTWLCACDCGKAVEVRGGNLRSGKSTNCGCKRRETMRAMKTTHGKADTETYNIWKGMIRRCTSPKCEAFPYYGGRGITVCERWKSFESFLEDMGERPNGSMSIERLDNDRGYELGNCVWATPTEQARNRSMCWRLTFQGRTMSVSAWAEETGIGESTIRHRIKKLGWPVERALTEPVR